MSQEDDVADEHERLNLEVRRIVAAHIRLLRQARGWSQEELAHRANIQRTFLQRIEANAANFSINVLLQISRAFQEPPASMFDPISPAPPTTPPEDSC